mmetsp:Transcript_15083/g.47378  ORF Transcript_15083/g.47378 Transcript_15083/m.47378 type:complete len:251 (+) Transcript_15083:3-755(+)
MKMDIDGAQGWRGNTGERWSGRWAERWNGRGGGGLTPPPASGAPQTLPAMDLATEGTRARPRRFAAPSDAGEDVLRSGAPPAGLRLAAPVPVDLDPGAVRPGHVLVKGLRADEADLVPVGVRNDGDRQRPHRGPGRGVFAQGPQDLVRRRLAGHGRQAARAPDRRELVELPEWVEHRPAMAALSDAQVRGSHGAARHGDGVPPFPLLQAHGRPDLQEHKRHTGGIVRQRPGRRRRPGRRGRGEVRQEVHG